MAWTLIAELNFARDRNANGGSSNSAITTGGRKSNIYLNSVEIYDTTSWSYNGTLNKKRHAHAGQGSVNEMLIEGGMDDSLNILSSCEEYNGTTWSYGGNLLISRKWHNGSGNLNSALTIAGQDYNDNDLKSCESYDGTSWTLSADINSERYEFATCGYEYSNSLIATGQQSSLYLSSSEEYNGTAWSYGGNINTERGGGRGTGTKALGLVFGGFKNSTLYNTTEKYDGTSFSFADNLNVGRADHGAFGTFSQSLTCGGDDLNVELTKAETYAEYYNLIGNVKDIYNNNVTNALIWIDNKSDLSDDFGNYSISGLLSGQYNITTTHENYFTDIYSINITQNESYNPILYPRDIQFKDILNLSNVIEWNEESNFEMNIEKNVNNSIVIDISKKDEIIYNFRVLCLNNSEKEYIYSFAGYKIKTLNINNIYNISNLYMIECSFEKKEGNESYWVGNLRFLQSI